MNTIDPTIQTDPSKLTFEQKVTEVIKTWFKGSGFHARKLTDTPTDDLQVVNRKYVNLNGTTAQRPVNPVVGQQYFDTTLDKPIFWDGTQWVLGGSTSQAKTATFVIGPSSNSDSASYDYTTDGTDDDVQIQAAIDALPSTGGSICFREGTYTLGSATVTIAKNGVELFGVGQGTIITCKANFNKTFFTLGHASTQYSNCTIRDMYIDGNQANISGTSYLIDNGTSTKPIINLLIQNNILINARSGNIYNTGASADTIISDNYISNWTAGIYAITSNNSGGYTKITNNYFTTNSTTGNCISSSGDDSIVIGNEFQLASAYNTTAISGTLIFSGNLIHLTGASGSSCILVSGGQVIDGNTVAWDGSGSPNVSSIALSNPRIASNNYIQGTGKGIAANNSARIIGNDISSLGHNIDLTVVGSGCTIVGNYLSGSGKSANATYSIIFIEGASGASVLITGNSLISGSGNNALYGIRENATTDGPNIITNNVIKGGPSDANKISVQNSGTDISHNMFNTT